MKKILFTLTILASATFLQAQTAYDALFFSRQMPGGTARTAAMGNAFTALGGDLGAISINPAASGMYKFTEVVFTPAQTAISAETDYLNRTMTTNSAKLYISNLGFVTSLPSRNSGDRLNFAFAINRLNDYSGSYSVSGKTNQYSWLSSMAKYLYELQGSNRIHAADLDITNNYNPYYDFPEAPWKFILAWNSSLLDTLSNGFDYVAATENITPSSFVIGGNLNYDFFRETSGANDEIVFNIGGSKDDKFFYGINIGIQTIRYTDYQEYSESAENSHDFQTGFSSFTHTYNLTTKGTGINIKAGFIYVPVKGFRIGGSISTPTWYSMTDEWYENIRSYFNDGYNVNLDTPYGVYDYRLQTPARLNLGAAMFLGSRGVLSVDYEGVDYSSIRLGSNKSGVFNNQNDIISGDFRYTNSFRAGLEIKAKPNLALRLGYNYLQNPEKNYGKDRHYGSVGVGYNSGNGFFADVAIQSTLFEENFSLSPVSDETAPVGNLRNAGIQSFVTVGFRF